MLNRQPQPEDPTASKDSDTESSDYESADEDLCLASSGGEQPRSDGKALTRESPPQAASSCSYGRLGIIAHVVKGLQRSSKADESTTPESVTTPTHSDATLAAELEPQPPDTTIRWEDPATGKVHYLDKVWLGVALSLMETTMHDNCAAAWDTHPTFHSAMWCATSTRGRCTYCPAPRVVMPLCRSSAVGRVFHLMSLRASWGCRQRLVFWCVLQVVFRCAAGLE